MSKEAEVTTAEERPTLSPAETRDTPPTTDDPDIRSEEVWTLVDVQDSTTMDNNGSNNTLNPDMSLEGEAEYTANTPVHIQDSTVQEGTNTRNPDMSTEGEAEYTASTSERTPEVTPGQYSPKDLILARENSREVVGSSIDLPYVTPKTTTGPPQGEYTPGDQKEVEIIYVAEGGKPGLSTKEKLRILANYYSQIPDMVTSTASTSQESGQNDTTNNELRKLRKEINDLRNAKRLDVRIINHLHQYNIHLHDMVLKGKIVSNPELLKQVVKLKVECENLKREVEGLSKDRKEKDIECIKAAGDRIYYENLFDMMRNKVEDLTEKRKIEKNKLESQIRKNTREIEKQENKIKNQKEELDTYKKLVREAEELKKQMENTAEQNKTKENMLVQEREAEKLKVANLDRSMARLQAKHNKEKIKLQANQDKAIKEKEDVVKARDDMIDKLGKENAKLEDKLIKANKQIEGLKNPNVAIRKTGPQREVEGAGSQKKQTVQKDKRGESPKIPNVAMTEPGPHREVEGDGSSGMYGNQEEVEYNTNMETIHEDPEVVDRPVEAQSTTILDDNKKVEEPKEIGAVPIPLSEREKRKNKKIREERDYYKEEVKKLQKLLDQKNKEIEERNRKSRRNSTREQGTNTSHEVKKASQYREVPPPTESTTLELPKPILPSPPKEIPPQYREDSLPVVIVHVTNKNRHMVSKVDKGLIVNPDGTLNRTPQYEAWIKNTRMQLENHFRSIPKLPEELMRVPNHPQPTSLDLLWSHEGDWYMFAAERGEDGEEPSNQRVVRVEKFIDLHGTIRKAFSYGEDESDLGVWYNFEEIKRAFPAWNPPDSSIYYNNKRFSNQIKRTTGGDQTPKPLQRARGRGKAIRREEERPMQRNQEWSKEKEREYLEWDRDQASGSRNNYRKHNEERRRRSPTPCRKGKVRYEKRFRSPSHEEDRKGRGRGRRRSRSQSSRRYHSQFYR